MKVGSLLCSDMLYSTWKVYIKTILRKIELIHKKKLNFSHFSVSDFDFTCCDFSSNVTSVSRNFGKLRRREARRTGACSANGATKSNSHTF